MRHLVEQLHTLEDRLREGGGAARIARHHAAGKMTARERIGALLDAGGPASGAPSSRSACSSPTINTTGRRPPPEW